MNIRNIALIAAVFSVAAANAQSFELRPVLGGNLVGFNADQNRFIVLPGSGTFTMQVWLNRGHVTAATGVYGALGFDWLTNATNSFVFTRRDNVLNIAGFTYGAFGPAIAINNPQTPTIRRAAITTGAGANYTATANNAPVVHYWGFQMMGVVNMAGTPSMGSYMLGTYSISYTLAANAIYGDDAIEPGLQMMNQGGVGDPTLGASGLNSVALTFPEASRIGSVKYQVEAVPEPMTMTALGLGLAAIAARRRRKG